MKLPTTLRAVPDATHHARPELFGSDDGFELSTIRDEDASIAMELLVGGYASPIEAVIRELYINADDSHRAAGQTRPVMITMPDEDMPFFIVSDQGLGLSAEEMVGTFTRPVASTKRDENFSAGGLGIGAKSPFTVADRFTVHGIKDGVSATLSMARIDGKLMHRVQDVVEVDPNTPNGVTVIVPVEVGVIESWWKALSRVHFWWDEGRFEITNDEAPYRALPRWTERILPKGETAPVAPALIRGYRDDFPERPNPFRSWRQENYVIEEPKVLMGQIAYEIPKGANPSQEPMVFHLPIGAVSVGQTREAMVDTPENRAVLEEMLHSWQERKLASFARRLIDPETSFLELGRIEKALRNEGLAEHFRQWARRTKPYETDEGLLPSSPLNLQAEIQYKGAPEMTAHGAHGGSVAHLWTVNQLAVRMRDSRVVFVDRASLAESRRKILTRWANSQNVVAVIVDRERFETMRFGRGWPKHDRSRRNDGKPAIDEATLVRPFAREEEIEWVDVLDIKVDRPAPAGGSPSGDSIIDVTRHPLLKEYSYRHQMESFSTTVDEIVTEVRGGRNRWAIIDTTAKLRDVPTQLPGRFVTISTGQRPASLVRKRLGDRALTVEQFMARRVELLDSALSKTQKRWIADEQICTLPGVRHYFLDQTDWITETDDPRVRAIAQEIAAVVAALYAQLGAEKPARVQTDGWQLTPALRGVRLSEQWYIDNSALGKYAPAVFAAQTHGFGVRTDEVVSTTTIALIRNTIATMLV